MKPTKKKAPSKKTEAIRLKTSAFVPHKDLTEVDLLKGVHSVSMAAASGSLLLQSALGNLAFQQRDRALSDLCDGFDYLLLAVDRLFGIGDIEMSNGQALVARRKLGSGTRPARPKKLANRR